MPTEIELLRTVAQTANALSGLMLTPGTPLANALAKLREFYDANGGVPAIGDPAVGLVFFGVDHGVEKPGAIVFRPDRDEYVRAAAVRSGDGMIVRDPAVLEPPAQIATRPEAPRLLAIASAFGPVVLALEGSKYHHETQNAAGYEVLGAVLVERIEG